MIEKRYAFKAADEKCIEKLIDDENVVINHMIFTKDTGLPQHNSNSNVYMIVIRGLLSLKLGDDEERTYPKGTIVNIPYDIKMNVNNRNEEILEIFVIKAPNPKDMPK